MKRWALLFLLLWPLAACDEPAPRQTPSASASAAPTTSAAVATPTLPLEATYKDKRLPLVSALAFSRGGSAVQVTMSTHELTCDHLRKAVTKHPDEVNFDLTVAPLLSADGKETWSLASARFGQVTRQGRLGPVNLSSYNPSEQIHMRFDHTLVFPPDKLILKGALDVKGCGVLPWSKGAEVRRQTDLKVTLAGKALTINGATLSNNTLRLSTEPHPCGTIVGSDIALTLTLGGGGVTAIRLEGYALPRTLFTKLESGVTVDRSDGDIKLAGEVQVGSYPLALEGIARAQVCS